MDNKNEQPLLEQGTLPDNHPLKSVDCEVYKIFDKSVLLNHTDGVVRVYHGGILDEQIAEIKNFTRCDVAKNSKEGLICAIQVYYEDPETGEDKVLYIDEKGNVSFPDTPLLFSFIYVSLVDYKPNLEIDLNLF